MTFTLLLSFGAAFAASLSPDEVVRAALAQDPALARAEAEVTAAEGALRAATGLRHDPTLEARLGFGLTQHEVSLSQPFSFSGEGRAAAQAARAGLEAAEAERAQRRLEVAAAARLGMIEVIDAQAEVARAKEAVVLTQRIRAQVERRLASGDVGELEVHLARLEEAAAVGGLLTATFWVCAHTPSSTGGRRAAWAWRSAASAPSWRALAATSAALCPAVEAVGTTSIGSVGRLSVSVSPVVAASDAWASKSRVCAVSRPPTAAASSSRAR